MFSFQFIVIILLPILPTVPIVNSFSFSNVNRQLNQLSTSHYSSIKQRNNRYNSYAFSSINSKALFMSTQVDENPYYKGLDAYQILEVPRTADKKDIKSAFRKLVAKWHPDKFPDDEGKKKEGGLRMEKINRAYFCIGEDDDRRRRYDQFGDQGVGSSAASEEQLKEAGGPGMGGGFGGAGGNVEVQDISDIFDAFFGGSVGGRSGARSGPGATRKRANGPVPGEDLQVELEIPFMTSIFGGQEKVRVRRSEECNVCTGSGVKPGSKTSTCSSCEGSGQVSTMQRTPFGVFNNVQTCPTCRGTGQEIEEYCPSCNGKGVNMETKEVVIKVPSGIESGSTLRVRDAGNSGRRGGPRGDLFVQLTVKKDPKFTREGTEIYTTEEISYTEAILGTTIKADTVDGKTDVKIPAGTQPEQRLRLRGKGAPKVGSDVRGDAFITVKVKIPQNVSGKEKELVEQLSEIVDKKKSGGSGFFGGFGSS